MTDTPGYSGPISSRLRSDLGLWTDIAPRVAISPFPASPLRTPVQSFNSHRPRDSQSNHTPTRYANIIARKIPTADRRQAASARMPITFAVARTSRRAPPASRHVRPTPTLRETRCATIGSAPSRSFPRRTPTNLVRIMILGGRTVKAESIMRLYGSSQAWHTFGAVSGATTRRFPGPWPPRVRKRRGPRCPIA